MSKIIFRNSLAIHHFLSREFIYLQFFLDSIFKSLINLRANINITWKFSRRQEKDWLNDENK
jgi:hypothetical protein